MTGLEEMQAFVEVISCGGVNRAAARLGLSKSIVSRRIVAIEADLGVQLLSRSTRGVVPTEAGQEFHLRCERILAEVADAREAATASIGDLSGRLRVTAPQVIGQLLVGPLLAKLAAMHPRLQIDAIFTDRIVDIVGEGIDLAVRIGEPRGASLIGRKIAPVRAVLVASPTYLEQAGRPESPGDLLGHHCIAYAGGGEWKFRQGRRWITVRPESRLRTDSGETIVQWATAGLGIGNVPEFLASSQLESGALVALLPDFPQPEYGLYTLRPPGPRAPAKVALLIEALAARMKEDRRLGC